MARLEIHLLGPFHVSKDGQPVVFSYDKLRALLAFLCVEHAQSLPRSRLSGLLWPDQSQTAAQDSLRQAISRLRAAIEDRDGRPPYLVVERDSLRMNLEASVSDDLAAFRDYLSQSSSHRHRNLHTCAYCVSLLEKASALVRGSFLEDIFLPDSDIFENWAAPLREQIKIQTLEIRGVLASYYEQRGETENILKYAAQQLLVDAYHEPAHRQVMRALANSGQRSQAVIHYNHLEQLLEDELGISPSPETLALFTQIKHGAALTNPIDQPLVNLPAALMPIVGRDVELSELVIWLSDPDRRLITLVGPGGVGKTHLALEAVRSAASMFANGVVYVPLSKAGKDGSLAHAIAATLRPFGAALPPAWPDIAAYFHSRQVLLVLDSFEHFMVERERISDLLETNPGLVLLVTSRERLNLIGEWVFALGGLDVPPTIMNSRLEAYSAVRMFCQCALQANRSFELNESNRYAIGEICRLVGGIPLALRLAASWSHSLRCHEIAAEIRRSLDFLSATPGSDDRHSSVRAVFNQSWQLLSDEERTVLPLLTVFSGGFDHADAEGVTGARVETLARLAGKSLLRVSPEGRYEFHDLLHQYAAEKLVDAGLLEIQSRRHFEWYYKQAEQNERLLNSDSKLNAFIWLIRESANLHTALNWAQENAPQQAVQLSGWIHADFHQFGVHRIIHQDQPPRTI